MRLVLFKSVYKSVFFLLSLHNARVLTFALSPWSFICRRTQQKMYGFASSVAMILMAEALNKPIVIDYRDKAKTKVLV